ncbi:hypothetical protein RDMS_12345 [Deinococcus sp. RL]|uniref:hypothetical protein n=1 Tax=Deinococcus sp. RL TaxID=1489678 RepID=UPI0004D9FC50|nr:hypothetical protein [Deinococcus sp. RL]KEF33462.1 hypothetical protein RDMS_12345 [Deinococcus sp. RL]
MSPLLPLVCDVPLRPIVPLAGWAGLLWTHRGERCTAAAHVLTEREVRVRRRLAAGSLAEQLSR